MDFGVAIFPTDETPDPATLARMAEERGFESLFFPEHTHIPVSRRTPYPVGGDLPREYARTFDPLVALSFAAAATTTLKLAPGLMLVAQRDPIVTAKAIASLDVLSGGRVLLGVGAGWNIEEMEDHGVDPARRFGRVRESVEAMRALGLRPAEIAGLRKRMLDSPMSESSIAGAALIAPLADATRTALLAGLPGELTQYAMQARSHPIARGHA